MKKLISFFLFLLIFNLNKALNPPLHISWARACNRISTEIGEFIQYASFENIKRIQEFVKNEGKLGPLKQQSTFKPLIRLQKRILAQALPLKTNNIQSAAQVQLYFKCVSTYIDLYLEANKPEYFITVSSKEKT